MEGLLWGAYGAADDHQIKQSKKMRSLTHCHRCNGGGTDGAADDLRREGRSNLLHSRLQLWIRRIFSTKNRSKDRSFLWRSRR